MARKPLHPSSTFPREPRPEKVPPKKASQGVPSRFSFGGRVSREALENEISELSDAIGKGSRDADQYSKLYAQLKRVRRVDEALKALNSAMEVFPNWSWPFSAMIFDLERMEKYDEALEVAERATLNFPDRPDFFYEKGKLATSLGRFDDAVKSFNQVISLRPLYEDTIFLRDSLLKQLEAKPQQRDSLNRRESLKDAKKSVFDLDKTADQAAILEAARQLIELASPETCAFIAGMALDAQRRPRVLKPTFAQSLIEIEWDRALAQFAPSLTEQQRLEIWTQAKAVTKPPIPKLAIDQIAAIRRRAKARPWSGRARPRMSALEWVRDNYAEWIPGLLQHHLKFDSVQLYDAFSKRVGREGGLPDWLDVPTEDEAELRKINDPLERAKVLAVRRLNRERMRGVRSLGL